MKWLVVALCLAQVAHISLANSVPVFVWGDTAYKSTPVLSNEAESILEDVLADESAKVIFVESQLNSDDFNYCSFEGEACFNYLGRQSSKFYSPSIESPLSYLRTRVWTGAVKTVNADEDFSAGAGETVFVHFRDGAAHSTHNDRLATHDTEIERIVSRLGDKGITYIYTAIEDHELHTRVARQAKQEIAEEYNYVIYRGDNYVMKLNQLAYLTLTGDAFVRTNVSLSNTTNSITYSNSSVTEYKLSLDSTPALVMDIIVDGGRWFVETLSFDGIAYTSGDFVGANSRFSYSCSPEITYRTQNSTQRLLLVGLQLEIDPARIPADFTYKMSFSENWNCVGFTSPGIWGGLFVTLLLLAIMTIGVSWMLDINTMDRFDDPKGKTITINAQD